MEEQAPEQMVECIIPTLKVSDLARSVAFYEKVLGFSKEWEYRSGDYSMTGLSRDGLSIYLSDGEHGTQQGWIWIGLEDDSLFESILSSGASIILEPTSFPYAYEMRIADPDGHILQLGTEPIK